MYYGIGLAPRDDTKPDTAKGAMDDPRAGSPPSKTLPPQFSFLSLSFFPLPPIVLTSYPQLPPLSQKPPKTTITMASSRVFASRLASAMAPTTRVAARPAMRAAVPKRTFTDARAAFRPQPLQTMKRQQPSTLLQANARQVFANYQSRRQYSSEIAQAMVAVSQNVGMGSAAIGLGGAGIGIGLVFAALLLSVSRNPALRGQLFTYAILGFAFVEAMGLFDLMVAMMCKYV